MSVFVEVPVIVKDPVVTEWKGVAPTEIYDPTNTRLKSRCDFHSTLDDPDELFYEVEFEG